MKGKRLLGIALAISSLSLLLVAAATAGPTAKRGGTIVLATLNVAAFILAEAGLSFLGLGIQLPTASWGNLLADAPQYYTSRPLLMVWPGIALLLTTLAFNLLGDGLRDAFDPRGSR